MSYEGTVGISFHLDHSQTLHMMDSTAIQAYRVLWKHLDADSYANNFNINVTSTEWAINMKFQHTTAASSIFSETILA